MRRILILALVLSCTPAEAPEQRRDSMRKALELTRLACIAYTMQRELGTVEAQPEADEVCRLLLEEDAG